MNLHSLRLFHEIAKWGSVTKAAEALRISQPAVTAQVKKFENEQQAKLLEADGRGVKLTELGQLVYSKSQQLFAIEAEIEYLLEKEQATTASILRIAGNYLTIQYVLPTLLASFKEVNTSTHIQLATLNTADAIAELHRGNVELALLGGGAEGYDAIARQKIYEDRLCFVVAPQHFLTGQPRQVSELTDQTFVGRESTSFTQQALLHLFAESQLKSPAFSFIYNNSGDAIQAVREGHGIHYCSYLMVADLIKRGELAEIVVPEIDSRHPIYLCWQEGKPLTLAARRFKKSVFELLH